VTAHGKSRKREGLILNLLACKTVAEAANASGISERTALRWLADPQFKTQFQRAKSELLDRGIMELRQGATEAAEALKKIVTKGKREHARVSAAIGLWRLLLDAHQLQELEQRLAALEEQTNADS
jgi:phage terminase small subunit